MRCSRRSLHVHGTLRRALALLTWFTLVSAVSVGFAQEDRAPSSPSSRLEAPSERPESYGALLVKMALSVLVICALAYILLRFGLKRLLPRSSGEEAIEVLVRQPIEPKRALLVVRVASRHLLLASSEAGVSMLTELTAEDMRSLSGAEPAKRSAPMPREFSLELDEPIEPKA